MSAHRDQLRFRPTEDVGPRRTAGSVSPPPGSADGHHLRAVGAAVELAVPHRRRLRVRRDLERAELLLVARVVRDGGIGPWRKHAEDCVQAARQRASGMRLSRTETAALVVALADERVRDGCWLQVEADPADPAWISLWSYLVRHALPPFRTEPLFLLAWSAWRLGDCALARSAVDAARREDPGHGAAAKLDVLLTAAVAPYRLRSLSDARTAGGGAP